MNKKFTTFLTAMLLLLGITSSFAQNPSNNPILEPGYPLGLRDARLVYDLEEGMNKGYFQIVWKDGFSTDAGALGNYEIVTGYNYGLAVNETTGELVIVDVTAAILPAGVTYESTFWCVEVIDENQSQRPKYDFVNRATGLPLQISMADLFGNTASDNIPLGETSGNATAHSLPIGTYDYDAALLLGGEISGWSLSPQYNNLLDARYGAIYSTYSANKVVGFWVDDLSVPGTPILAVKTVAFNDADNTAFLDQFRLRAEADITLTANQINNMMGQLTNNTAGVKLTFDPDVYDTGDKNLDFSNPFTQNNFVAVPSTLLPGIAGTVPGSGELVNLRLAGSTATYLKLDTIYHNNTGSQYLKFNWDNLTTRVSNMIASNEAVAGSTVAQFLAGNMTVNLPGGGTALTHGMEQQYNFLFTYNPSYDSLYIQVRGAYDIPTGKTWKDAINDVNRWTQYNSATPLAPYNRYYFAYPYVSIQDLSAGRVLTVHSGNQDTHVSFGFENCNPVAINKTSVDDGLYFIRNTAKQYLASPIHFNGRDARFETIEKTKVDQEPLHMPAYQWVVLKDRYYSDEVKPTSPITVYNREFPDLWMKMQLNKDQKGIYISGLSYNAAAFPQSTNPLGANYVANYVFPYANGDYLTFEQITEQKIIEDPYLGYRKFSEDSLLINKYVFNYLHSFNLNTYLTKGTGRDSIVYASEDNKGQFVLRSLKRTTAVVDSLVAVEYNYGYPVTTAISTSRIKGLAQLKRTPYYIALNNEGTIGQTTEDRYSVGKHSLPVLGNLVNEYSYPHDTTFFYLKENNHYIGKHYFAMVDFDWSSIAGTIDPLLSTATVNHTAWALNLRAGGLRGYKAGVDDSMGAVLKVQDLETESRTSAFAIGNDESPLYRRFNSEDEKVNKDTTVVLRFVEGYRHNEYLQVENNKSFMKKGIDYLGIWTEDRAASGISFYVDTAWVNRGAGYIKPQYLIMIEREEFAGKPAEPCPLEHNHGTDPVTGEPLTAETCSHAIPAIPGYVRGKYLVNFGGFSASELAAVNNRNRGANVLPIKSTTDTEFDDTYRWRGYDRAGFLQGIHIQDTLIILNSAYDKYNPANTLDKMNIEAIKADSKNAVFDLRYDNHKYVTWSMRYIEPEKAFLSEEEGKNKTFLMESMKRLNRRSSITSYVEPDIAPLMAQWIKMQNGCLVLSDPDNSYFDQMRESDSSTGGDDALIFDVEVGSKNQIAKDNEDAVSANVVVIGGNGSVTVKNAAGKAVVITNVLGQTIANTVVSSDNATISVPQGIVVVSVQGESAVKAIVK